ncbi:aminodeoxychorismate synthase component I [Devosia sp. XJ19-1]|uniref:Probable branched-chain-amino-acid aminotransferase n=1 Tax=Devosia ureilytica TaxID=2952754 RepID=A0A9Q4AM99_9HYPH|nr:aminodeoxychorismate synthase component I [Devosia ureilytica]MCP8882933.1 aminodeoxychorismate synthase component I [Devosia ureilytica]MCP8886699.1 aminodeoxychorismate synthase component I [Devosia ureilytica]
MFTPGTVLLHDNLTPQGQNLLFTQPREVLVAHDATTARHALARLAVAHAQGLWVAGYFAYELGFLFEDRLAPLLAQRSATPLLWLGLYEAPQPLSCAEVAAMLDAAGEGRAVGIAPKLDRAAYGEAFAQVKDFIAAGDTYQVNLTMKAGFRLEGDPLGLYRTLAHSQRTAYGAYIEASDHVVLSRSPELFVSGTGDVLRARPMKGTQKRGRTLAEDAQGRALLAADEKNRAENLMIVDLLRNDLGRIAETGSVKVTDLFTVETYRSLHTMTSGILARKQPGVDFGMVLENLFPCGSITGAPKLRSMEIIHALEQGPRGLYTGAIGYLAPNGDFAFNVAIRTAVIDAAGQGEIGIGGGIVADSVLEDEYEEALLKLNFLSDPAPPVTLIETFKWTPDGGFDFEARHLDRLEASARYFMLEMTRAGAAEVLAAASRDWTGPMRVRLTLSDAGFVLTAVPLPPSPESFRFGIAEEKLDAGSVWLAHKTTNRAFYDNPRQVAHDERGLDELVFRNTRGELTEGSFTNLFIERNGRLLTPPLSSGLLPGTLRAELIATGKADEQVLTLADLAGAEAIWLGNSVRGLVRAQWIDREDHIS